jgi:hypothetical protein
MIAASACVARMIAARPEPTRLLDVTASQRDY